MSGEYTVFRTAIVWGEGVGGREYQNQNKSQGINNPLMTAEQFLLAQLTTAGGIIAMLSEDAENISLQSLR